MKKNVLFGLWACLFILCAALGFIPEPEGTLQIVLTGFSLLFFLPPVLLLRAGVKQRDADAVRLIRNLSALSLGLSLVLLVLNLLAALRSELLGQILHYVLVIVSSPMICSGHWAMSLFLWACLLMASAKHLKR